MDDAQSLNHSVWDCKYHVVFVPKRRRKTIFGQVRRQLGQIFHGLARQKECQILEGHLMPDHVHMCIAIPPKHPVASVIGFLKGKSAIAIARLSDARFRMPPESSAGISEAVPGRPTSASLASTMRRMMASGSWVCSRYGSAMLSPTVIEPNSAPA